MEKLKETTAAFESPHSDVEGGSEEPVRAPSALMRQDRARLVQAVHESIHAYASPDVASAILEEALANASLSRIPSDPRVLRSFTLGPLKRAATRLVEPAVGAAIAEALIPIVAMAQRAAQASGVRPARSRIDDFPSTLPPPDGVTDGDALTSLIPLAPLLGVADGDALTSLIPLAPLSEGPETIPLPGKAGASSGSDFEFTIPVPAVWSVRVLMTSHNMERAEALRSALSELGELIVLEDAVSLLDELESDNIPQFIVIDCVDPTVQPATMLTLAGDLHEDTQVILWGAAPSVESELIAFCNAADSWVRAKSSTSAIRVASLIEALSMEA